jgi:indole-3-glycerol phosphate synthase
VADLLDRMRRASERRARAARAAEPEGALLARALATPAPAELAWSESGFDLVAEVKRRAPSAGRFSAGESATPARLAARARAYASAGAAAISVLTEPDEFGGSLDDLAAVARAVPRPVMRKDFLVDPVQVVEARAAGAGGVLAIVRMLGDAELDAMIDAARQTGLFVLLEAFDERDLDRAGAARERAAGSGVALPVGLNVRDLRTLGVDLDRAVALARRFPADSLRVAESGIAEPEDAARVARAGYRAALVGSALMREDDPAPLVRSLIEAGRAAARRSCVSE